MLSIYGALDLLPLSATTQWRGGLVRAAREQRGRNVLVPGLMDSLCCAPSHFSLKISKEVPHDTAEAWTVGDAEAWTVGEPFYLEEPTVKGERPAS